VRGIGGQLLRVGLCLAGLLGGGCAAAFAAVALVEAVSPGATRDRGDLLVTMSFGPSGMLAGGWAGFRLGDQKTPRRD
jgi:hypothetical protein